MFIVAMGLGGTIADFFGTNAQREFNKLAGQVNQAQLDVNLAFANAKAKDESVNEMIALRKNLSHMSAVQNARGTSIGAGSSLFVRQESEQIAKKDEDLRELNLDATVATLHGKSLLNDLQTTSTDIELKTGLSKRIFNTASAGMTSVQNQAPRNFAPVSDSSSNFSSGRSSSRGFGMEPV
jgi:hypothetical protein